MTLNTDKILELESSGRPREALNYVFDFVDDLLLEGKFDEVDEIFKSTSVSSVSNDVLLTIITATIHARKKFNHRDTFLYSVWEKLGDFDGISDIDKKEIEKIRVRKKSQEREERLLQSGFPEISIEERQHNLWVNSWLSPWPK